MDYFIFSFFTHKMFWNKKGYRHGSHFKEAMHINFSVQYSCCCSVFYVEYFVYSHFVFPANWIITFCYKRRLSWFILRSRLMSYIDNQLVGWSIQIQKFSEVVQPFVQFTLEPTWVGNLRKETESSLHNIMFWIIRKTYKQKTGWWMMFKN
jgi:hypothetical protein